MKKKWVVTVLGIILALSSGCGARSAASRFCAALEDTGFMYEEAFNAAYCGGRFETAEQMYGQLCRDGVSGLIVPTYNEAERPDGAEYSAFEISGLYFDGGSIFFPFAARAAFAEFESADAAADYYSQTREALMAAALGEPAEDSGQRFYVTAEDGTTLLSRKGRTVLIFSGESERIYEAVEKSGF